MQGSYIITGIMSLRRLKTKFFHLAMDFKKKKESGMSDKLLQNWVKVGKKRLDRIKNQIQKAKDNNLQARPERGSPIYLNEPYKLIQDIEHGKITHEEVLRRITNIRNDIKILDDLDNFNENQDKVLNAYFMVDEIFTGELKWYKLIDDK